VPTATDETGALFAGKMYIRIFFTWRPGELYHYTVQFKHHKFTRRWKAVSNWPCQPSPGLDIGGGQLSTQRQITHGFNNAAFSLRLLSYHGGYASEERVTREYVAKSENST
jgi:hypothetical protein